MNQDGEEYIFTDPFILLQGLVVNSPEINVKYALLGVVHLLLSGESAEIDAADILDGIAQGIMFMGDEIVEEFEGDFGDLTTEQILDRFRSQLGMNNEEGEK